MIIDLQAESLVACQRGCRLAAITEVMRFNSSDEKTEACVSGTFRED